MILLSSIISLFEERFRGKYFITDEQKSGLAAMKICRQYDGPQMLVRCCDDDCGELRYVPHSCGHRICPHCQNHESQQWIDNQLGKLLPARYFMITFTLAKQLRDLAKRHQDEMYPLMFEAVQQTLKSFTRNDKKLGGEAGFTAILHTHSRRLDFHPHIHVVMPAASLDEKTGLWRKKSDKYIFHHKNLAKVFRGKLLEAIAGRGLPVPPKCHKDWVVDCKDVGRGDKAIVYLGRYLYRGVIQEKDIIRCDGEKVTFRYIDSKTKKQETRTVSGEKFLFLLLQHVLPKGFRRARSYGFLHPCSKRLIRLLQLVLKVNPLSLLIQKNKRPMIRCRLCGQVMEIIKTRVHRPPAIFSLRPSRILSREAVM